MQTKPFHDKLALHIDSFTRSASSKYISVSNGFVVQRNEIILIT